MPGRDGLKWPDLGPASWRPTTVKWRQSSQSNRHSTISTQQTQYHEVLPSLANVQSHLTSLFADDGNASWYWVCRVPMVEWQFDCEDCRHLTVIGLHDTGPWWWRKDCFHLWRRFFETLGIKNKTIPWILQKHRKYKALPFPPIVYVLLDMLASVAHEWQAKRKKES